MAARLIGSAALAMLFWCSSPASAQIISTMIPLENVSGASSTVSTRQAFHLMAGFTNWDFGFDQAGRDQVVTSGGSTSGGRNGVILAGDFSGAVADNLTIGGGGWYNKVTDWVLSEPAGPTFNAYELTVTRAFSSIYGNVFYRHVGVQAGIIPARGKERIVLPGLGSASDDLNQTDANVFAVARFGAARSGLRWHTTAGAGLHVYGTIPASSVFSRPESPSAAAFTAFANASIGFGGGVSLDASFWYVGADKNYSSTSRIGNTNQSRFTIGIGYGR